MIAKHVYSFPPKTQTIYPGLQAVTFSIGIMGGVSSVDPPAMDNKNEWLTRFHLGAGGPITGTSRPFLTHGPTAL